MQQIYFNAFSIDPRSKATQWHGVATSEAILEAGLLRELSLPYYSSDAPPNDGWMYRVKR